MSNFFDYRNLASKLKFKIMLKNENDIKNLMVDAKKIETYTQSVYWLDVIIFDLMGAQNALIKLEQLVNDDAKNSSIKKNILDEHEIYTTLDIAINKMFSANDKIAQLINCVYELGLKEYGREKNVVSYGEVKKAIEIIEPELFLLLCKLNNFKEFNKLRLIRNAFVHHYNPFHLTNYFVLKSNENQIELSSQYMHLKKIFELDDEKLSNPLWLKESIKRMEKQYQEVLPEIIDNINKYYNTDAIKAIG